MNNLTEAEIWLILILFFLLVSFLLSYVDFDIMEMLEHPTTFGPL